ncbi:cellulase family glycosylhydrolase [Actinocrinis sp.]|uniref:cellulase family glycosylhydrolase n=1 Tax=Actinocrinis sp. TaxID=1920516 RepID=UPI002D6087C3|nr:cellulase family glycosylhydrolase [Actinocrinis sp.]HZP53363.1 cellulase family glycosylhydrolase [Actinocrinis sp.]
MSLSARRLAPWLVAAFIIAIGSVAMAVSALPSRPQQQTVHIIESTDNGFVFGLNYADELPAESAPALAQSLDDAGSVGAGWIRTDLAWYRIQTGPDSWDWSSFDRTVAYAKARGLKVLAVLGQAPVWARDSACATKLWCPPADDARFAEFAAKAAQRYPVDLVPAWEVWNEENTTGFWAGGADPAAYGALLKATATAVRAVQPRAQIIFGGLAISTTGNGLAPRDFLLSVARAGFLPYADAIAYHPYSYPKLPSAAPVFAAISTGSNSLAAVLDDYHAASMPIWLTETGAPVGAAADPYTAASIVARGEQSQATYVTDLVTVATHNSHVKALFWFSDIDLPGQNLYFGLRRADGTHRPSFEALTKAIGAYKTE